MRVAGALMSGLRSFLPQGKLGWAMEVVPNVAFMGLDAAMAPGGMGTKALVGLESGVVGVGADLAGRIAGDRLLRLFNKTPDAGTVQGAQMLGSLAASVPANMLLRPFTNKAYEDEALRQQAETGGAAAENPAPETAAEQRRPPPTPAVPTQQELAQMERDQLDQWLGAFRQPMTAVPLQGVQALPDYSRLVF